MDAGWTARAVAALGARLAAVIPSRPRLADHARARRHVGRAAGVEAIVVLHVEGSDGLALGPREWELLAAADGTRDLEGVRLSALGHGVRAELAEVEAFFAELAARGALADGPAELPAPGDPDASCAPGDPGAALVALPGYGFRCDGRGECCVGYETFLFTPADAARARGLVPEVLDGGVRHEAVFTPERGARPLVSAVALVDGGCAYLASDGRCRVHVAGGPGAKPGACERYPRTHVDDGAAVRVSVAFECTCVVTSLAAPDAAPLVGPGARRAQLSAEVSVAVVPERVALAQGRDVERAEVVALLDRMLASPPDEPVAALLAAARELDGGDLEAAARAFEAAGACDASALRAPLADAARRAHRAAARVRGYRGPADRVRLGIERVRDASLALTAEGMLAELAALPAPSPEVERLYLRAALHGRAVLLEGGLADALRARALRLLVARAVRALAPTDPGSGWRDPLPSVERVFRAHLG